MTTNGTGIRHFGTVAMPHDWPEPERLDAKDVEVLGALGYVQYAREKAGERRELRIGREVQSFDQGNRPDPGELHIESTTLAPHPTYGTQRMERVVTTIRAYVIEPGTFEKLNAGAKAMAERKVRAGARAKARHRTDVAELLPVLDRMSEVPLVLGAPVDLAVAPLSKGAKLIERDSREAVRGIESIAAWLAASGVKLGVVDGYLDVRSAGMSPALREVIDIFGPLLVGHLSGKPVPCALRHVRAAPAYTVAVGAMPVCREHLEELDR